jgi:retinol dehydrogenase-12
MTAQVDMTGRTCMITGASSGVGRATALGLARLGATLLLVCRDRGRGEETVAEIRDTTGNRAVTLMLADLSSQESIRALAREFLATAQPLHVLVNNAGIVNLRRSVTAEGIETVFAVNHLAYFLLTHLLLDRLKESAPARIVNVASHAHRFSGIDFDDLEAARRYRAMRVYGQSKLANILFTYELARRLTGTGVTVNCVHPGAVASGLGKNNGAWARGVIALLRPFFRTPEDGAATSIYLVSSPDLEQVTGKYFANCQETRSAAVSYDTAVARRLWDVSARMTNLSVVAAAGQGG